MGLQDTATAKYIRQNQIFADIFNYFLYNGEKVIRPDSLEELDTREIEVPYGGEQGAEQPVQRTRDVMKSVVAMTDRRAAYLVLAVENQSSVGYAMPVRDMVYDALQYAEQVEKAAASHRKSGDYKGVSRDEFLSKFLKEDRLIPVITLVIYWSSKKWDGPMSLHEMFVNPEDPLLVCVPDYTINLIEPASILEDDFDKFETTLKEVLAFIKYSGDVDKLREIVEGDPAFHHMGREETDVLNACVNANLTIKYDEEVVDVCEAMQVLEQRAREEGRLEGKREGQLEGRREGKLEGRREGQLEGRREGQLEGRREGKLEGRREGQLEGSLQTRTQDLRALMDHFGVTAEKAMDILGISESERETYLPLL